ncbi:hypothetical protein K438DRAFT_1764250 [Mycena galopus ATCC 62051]|nr:hypothetical protein K438DRAFT_1764250 [Mycena galopus ATCC 62051]
MSATPSRQWGTKGRNNGKGDPPDSYISCTASRKQFSGMIVSKSRMRCGRVYLLDREVHRLVIETLDIGPRRRLPPRYRREDNGSEFGPISVSVAANQTMFFADCHPLAIHKSNTSPAAASSNMLKTRESAYSIHLSRSKYAFILVDSCHHNLNSAAIMMPPYTVGGMVAFRPSTPATSAKLPLPETNNRFFSKCKVNNIAGLRDKSEKFEGRRWPVFRVCRGVWSSYGCAGTADRCRIITVQQA